MKKYEKYKDSGIEWIGEIPSHWDIKRFKYSFKFINEKCELDLPKIGLEHIESSTGKRIENDTDFEGDGTCFQIDDILFGKLRPYLAKVFLSDFIGKAVGDFFVFRPEESIYPKFGHKFLLSRNFIEITNSSTFGSKMPRVSPDFINELKTIVPPFGEQTAIASYLDRKTSEIDELIADKKRLLELYEEEKTAIINELVTGKKVWDGNAWTEPAKVKDSGIEWLGEIPEHWEMKKLKTIASVQTGRTPKIQNSQLDYFESGEYNWFTPADFEKNNELIESRRKIIKEAIESNEVELFPEYSIYLVSIGATLGKVSFFREKASANQQINIISFKDGFDPLFGYYFLVGNKEMITLEADYTTLPILNQSKTKTLLFAVPPIGEQKSIVHHIETECTSINTQIKRTKKLIDLLTEYRTALISEAVTGKIKVTE